MTSSAPRLRFSVIVPVFQGANVLPSSLTALRGSDFPREEWELIVVDDTSTDSTPSIATTYADTVVTLRGKPHGPGLARNRGVEKARGEWLVFVDADVVVHPNTLSTIDTVLRTNPDIVAVFGAYDTKPPAPNFLSQYRNLLHRYVHLQGAGDADTFWAGCGAVRHSAFVAIGGFDEHRYTRPQIEDIELGYRLRDAGGRILLRPEIQGAHLKRWMFAGSNRTDVFDRGVPWVRLLLERGKLGKSANLNLKPGERYKTVAVGLAPVLMLASIVLGRIEPAIAGFALLAAVSLSNRALIQWFAQTRGLWFALRVIPLNLWYYVVSGVSVALALVQHLTDKRVPVTHHKGREPRESVTFTGHRQQ